MTKNTSLFLSLFLLINIIFSIFYLDYRKADSQNARVYTIISLVHDHTNNIDKYKDYTGDISYVNGHYYAGKSPLPTYFVYIIYKTFLLDHLISYMQLDEATWLCMIGAFVVGVLPFIYLLYLFYKQLEYKFPASKYNILIIMITFYGSMFFIYSNIFYNHVLVALILLLSYHFYISKKYALLGICIGICMLAEYSMLLLLPIYICYIFYHQKKWSYIVKLTLGFIPFLILFFIDNYFVTNSIFKTSYSFLLNYSSPSQLNYKDFISLKSIYGLLFSEYRGLFFYMPILLLILYILKVRFKNYMTNPIMAIILIHFIYISTYNMWWGGWTYGPRHLIPISILLLYLIFENIDLINKYVFLSLSSIGFVLMWMARLTTTTGNPSLEHNPFQNSIIPSFIKLDWNDVNLLTYFIGTNTDISNLLWLSTFLISVLILQILHNKFITRISISN